MVVTEIALAVAVLVGAGLMMRSLFRLLQTNVGFNTENVMTMTVVLPPSKYMDPNQQIGFNDRLRERVQSLPGVTGAGTVNILPLNAGNTTRFYIDGDPVPQPGKKPNRTFALSVMITSSARSSVARWTHVRHP